MVKTAILRFKEENLDNPKSALPYDFRVILEDGIRLGYETTEYLLRQFIVSELEKLRRPFPEENPISDRAWDAALDEVIYIVKGK